MTFASFAQDVERLIDDPFAIAGRLKPLLAADGWLAREHQLAGGERLSSRCYDDVSQFLPGPDRRFPDAGCRRPAVV